MTDDLIISCDWGSSRFRLTLVETKSNTLLASVNTADGIAAMHDNYYDVVKDSAAFREEFYLLYLQQQIEELTVLSGKTLDNLPVVVSGMASSTLGIRQLDYAQVPFDTNDANMVTNWIQPSTICRHPVLLLSGVRSAGDVMRGEETQLIGIRSLIGQEKTNEGIFILPGTHSKHIYVRKGMIEHFCTFMTGELFGLLYRHSILQDAVAATETLPGRHELQSFVAGVRASGTAGLLRSLFTVRTNWALKGCDRKSNYYFLSGLLIGEELRALQATDGKLFLAANDELRVLYQSALQALELSAQMTILPAGVVDAAAAAGQIQTYKKMKHNG